MRSQIMLAAAVVMSLAAVPAFAYPSNPDGPNLGGPTTLTPSTTFSGYGMGEQPNNEATARWCQEMAANGHNRGHAYASWCAQQQQQPNG
jgi:hypothetical protein